MLQALDKSCGFSPPSVPLVEFEDDKCGRIRISHSQVQSKIHAASKRHHYHQYEIVERAGPVESVTYFKNARGMSSESHLAPGTWYLVLDPFLRLDCVDARSGLVVDLGFAARKKQNRSASSLLGSDSGYMQLNDCISESREGPHRPRGYNLTAES